MASVVSQGDTIVLSLSPAYIHRSAGQPGSDSGTVWLQSVTLALGEASSVSAPTEFPAVIYDGFLRVNGNLYENLIPADASFEGNISLSLTLSTTEPLTIQACSIRIQRYGIPSFLEDFRA